MTGNLTSTALQQEHCVGPQWHDWSLEKQDQLVAILIGDDEDDVVQDRLKNEFNLSKPAIEGCLQARLQEGTASLSLKAARLLTEKMRTEHLNQPEAVEKVAAESGGTFINPYTRAGDTELESSLPYYGEAFQERHIIPGRKEEKDRGNDLKYFGGITNPTVHIALNQIRQVVNELIKRYGQPTSMAIELARELPEGDEKRRETEREQTKNQQKNERLNEILKENGQLTNRENRLRVSLWEELDEDPCGRCCPFSGKKIGIADLFNGNTEIEHLIPYSQSLDNSRANKVLCTKQANRDKGQQTPWQAFHSHPDYNWQDIFAHSQRLPKSKQWRFQEDALDIWRRDGDGFSERHLNDTRYIGRIAREYLAFVCPFNKIDILTGHMTAILRAHWGLNSLLSGHNQPDENGQKPKKKNREDHRHHAIDAIVIGMTSLAMLQRVSTAAAQLEKDESAHDLNLGYLFPKQRDGKSLIDPWSGFRSDAAEVINSTTVSHRSRRKSRTDGATDGQLHQETAYGLITKNPDKNDRYEGVVRKSLESFRASSSSRKQLESIRDPHLREEFLKIFDEEAAIGNAKSAIESVIAAAKSKGIRSLRCVESLKLIPIKDGSGNIYKGYAGGSNWAMEIYQYPDKHPKAGDWAWVVISRFDANQPDFKLRQTHRPHPAARLLMRLQRDDFVKVDSGGAEKLMRVQKISEGIIYFVAHNEANESQRQREKDPLLQMELVASVGKLKSLNPRKVHISPTGLVNYDRRSKPENRG